MTRYGYVELTNQASSLGNAADYLSKIGVNSGNPASQELSTRKREDFSFFYELIKHK